MSENELRPDSTSRRRHADLLARPPCGFGDLPRGWRGLIIDPVAQLEELADLVKRGLLSQEEFDRLKHRVVE
jgi:Short C-terminal domain